MEIPYDTHAINAYNLHQSNDESTSAYLHRVQDILECIHNTSDMTSIPPIGTNHAKILTGLQDRRLCNKLAESKVKKWTTMSQVLQDVTDMAIDFERSHGYSLSTFEVQYISPANSSSSFRSNKPSTRNVQQPSNQQEKPKCWHYQRKHYKKDCLTAPKPSSPSKYKSTREKQHNLIKIYCKKIQDRRQIYELCTPASDSGEEFNNFIVEFKNIMLEDLDDSSA